MRVYTTMKELFRKTFLKIAPGLILALVFILLASLSVKDESIIWDELAHIPASFSYIKLQDYRLNPEHPPLVKDIAGLIIASKEFVFPTDAPEWNGVNKQWEIGRVFLFGGKNDADKIVWLSRLPLIITWGVLIFLFYLLVAKEFGYKTALLSTFLLSFSPTFLAHGRYVTTDVGAGFAYFFAIYFFAYFLKAPTKKRMVLAGIVLGLAQLTKFSVFLLYPVLAIFMLIWVWARSDNLKELFSRILWWTPRVSLLFLVSLLVVFVWYLPHIKGYPIAKQFSDTKSLMAHFSAKNIIEAKFYEFIRWASGQPVIRALAHYLVGVAMVIQRVRGGNSMYFMGEVSAEGWRRYFPIVYLVKEPLGVHILTLLSLVPVIGFFKTNRYKGIKAIKESVRKNSLLWLALIVIVVYWLNSITSKLNLGIRHLTPVLILTYLVIGRGVYKLLLSVPRKIKRVTLFGIIFLVLWNIASVLSVYPDFLTYFNVLGGRADRGYLISVDSNYDWGQDLIRLKKWTERQGIKRLYLDYYGTADPKYYFGKNVTLWWGKTDPQGIERPTYFAVSASSYVSGRARPVKGFPERTDNYWWLDNEVFVERVGSILVFWLPQR